MAKYIDADKFIATMTANCPTCAHKDTPSCFNCFIREECTDVGLFAADNSVSAEDVLNELNKEGDMK